MDPAVQPDNNKRKREDEVAVPAAPDAAPDYATSLMAEEMKKMQDQMVAMQEALVNAQAETKKAKTESSSSSSQLPDEAVFPLDSTGRRKVKVRVYQGRLGIDIRDYYKKGDVGLICFL